jgi:hypothetical protein
MGAIYGQSKLTIAAVKSEGGNGGCFIEDTVQAFVVANPMWNLSMVSRKLPKHRAWEFNKGYYKGDGWVTPRLTRPKDHNIRHRRILPNTTLYARDSGRST